MYIKVFNKVVKTDRKFSSMEDLKKANIFDEGTRIQIDMELRNGDKWECEFFLVYMSESQEAEMAIKLPEVSSKYGAPMGRASHHPDELSEKVYLEQVEMFWGADCGAYDTGGAYWGMGDTLYLAQTKDQDENLYWFLRGKTREKAKEEILEKYPEAEFYR